MSIPNAHGHRERVRARVRSEGLDNFQPHEVLEYLLMLAIPRVDTKPIAKRLLVRYGSFHAVLDASPDDLCATEGVGSSAAVFLSSLPPLFRYYARSRAEKSITIDKRAVAKEYVTAQLTGYSEEALLCVCLDVRGNLIKTDILARGTTDSVFAPPQKILTCALNAKAKNVILAHNHPAGSPNPSIADIEYTQNIAAALHSVDIKLQDHLIVTDRGCESVYCGTLWEDGLSYDPRE